MLKLALGAAFALLGSPLCAQTVTATLPNYNGPLHTSGFPVSLGTIGTFTYVAPAGATIGSAFLEGTYGTSNGYAFSTGSFNASIDGTSLTLCAMFAANCFVDGSALRTFSILVPASAYGSLLDGSAALAISQTTGSNVRFGTPTLRINFIPGAVPEPTTWAMFLLGFGAIGAQLRRRSVSALQTA